DGGVARCDGSAARDLPRGADWGVDGITRLALSARGRTGEPPVTTGTFVDAAGSAAVAFKEFAHQSISSMSATSSGNRTTVLPPSVCAVSLPLSTLRIPFIPVTPFSFTVSAAIGLPVKFISGTANRAGLPSFAGVSMHVDSTNGSLHSTGRTNPD